ncbi:MAG: GerMN domain-containing protein [Austwickia sp.]|nr:GerMN domain-containing protein [Austwickia sp.]
MTRPSTDDLAAALRARAEATDAPDGALADRAIAGGLRRRRRTVAASLSGLAAALVLMVAVAVGTHQLGAFPPERVPAATQTQDASPDGDIPPPGPTPTGPTMTTTVYLGKTGDTDCSKTYPVQRTVPRTSGVTRAALIELLKGPSAQERAQGYTGWFSPATEGGLRDVRVTGGTAYVDLADLRATIPNASTSCGSAALLAELTETTTAAAHVDTVRFAIDGQPAIFWGWLERGCEDTNDRCDPTPFGTLRYADLPVGAAVHPQYRVEQAGTADAAHYAYVDEAGRVDLPREAGPAYVVRRAGDQVVLMANGWTFTGGSMNDNRQIYVIGADRSPRLLVRGNLAAVSVSTDGRYVAYTTASAAAAQQDRYDELVIRAVDTGRVAGTVAVAGRYELTWSGHVVTATSSGPDRTTIAWDVDRGAHGTPMGPGNRTEAISPDGTRGLRRMSLPWAIARPGEGADTREQAEVVALADGRSVHLRAPLTAVPLMSRGVPLWEDDRHVLLEDIGAGGDSPALIRCDAVTGACEQAPDPGRLARG